MPASRLGGFIFCTALTTVSYAVKHIFVSVLCPSLEYKDRGSILFTVFSLVLEIVGAAMNLKNEE